MTGARKDPDEPTVQLGTPDALRLIAWLGDEVAATVHVKAILGSNNHLLVTVPIKGWGVLRFKLFSDSGGKWDLAHE